MTKAKLGDVVQIHPTFSDYGAMLGIVDKLISWGVVVCVFVPATKGDPGRHYVQVSHDFYEVVGTAQWVPEDIGQPKAFIRMPGKGE